MYRLARDPASTLGSKESDDTADIVGLRKSLQRLHAKHSSASGVVLHDETGHVGFDDPGRDGIDADTAVSQS